MGDEEEGGTGGALAKSEDIIAQYQTARIRAFWTGYKRYKLDFLICMTRVFITSACFFLVGL